MKIKLRGRVTFGVCQGEEYLLENNNQDKNIELLFYHSSAINILS